MSKNLRFKLTALLLAVVLVFPVSAFDGGGQIDLGASVSAKNFLSLDDFIGFAGGNAKATGWLRLPFNFGTFSMESSWNFNGYYVFVWPLTLTDAQYLLLGNTLDINLLKFSTTLPVVGYNLSLNAGRYAVADATGLIFNQKIDGMYASLQLPLFTASLGMGYTGLLNAKTTGVYNVPVDVSSGTIYAMNPGYVAVTGNAIADNLYAGQSVGGEVNLFFNCRTVPSDELHRSYLTVYAKGPLISSLFYNLTFAGNMNFGSQFSAGLMGKGMLLFYPGIMSSCVSFTVVFATSGFIPFTNIPVTADGLVHYSDLLDINLNLSAKVSENSVFNLAGSLLYTSLEDEVAYGLREAQISVSSKYQKYSDVSYIISADAIIPVAEDSAAYFTFSARIQLSL